MPVFLTAENIDVLALAEAKAALNIAASDTSVDTELAQVVTAASRTLDRWAGAVVLRTVTEEPHAGGTVAVSLEQWPVDSVTTVEEWDGTTVTTLDAGTFGTTGDYTVDPATGIVTRSGYARFAGHGVRVTYVAGRFGDTASVTADFKEACAKIVAHYWQTRGAQSGAGTFGGDGAPFGGVPYSTATLRKHVMAALSSGPVIA